MSIFSAKSFWLSLPFSGVLTYWLFWIQIPDALSGNPGADGTAVSGWPIPVETSGGCNFGGSCMDFSYPFFVIDIVILSFISALIAYYISSMINKNIKKETEVQGILTYLGSWLSVLALTATPLVFIANIVDWRTKQIILKWSALIYPAVSILFNLYYFRKRLRPFWGFIYVVSWVISTYAVVILMNDLPVEYPFAGSIILLGIFVWTIIFHLVFFWLFLGSGADEKPETD